jgi:hypothetical protein
MNPDSGLFDSANLMVGPVHLGAVLAVAKTAGEELALLVRGFWM